MSAHRSLGWMDAPRRRQIFSSTEGFYAMIYPVSLRGRFEIPVGSNGESRLQKLLPILGWETKNHNQYCALGALVKVDLKHEKTDRGGAVHRSPDNLLRQAHREAMGLMNPLERSRLHIGQPDFVDRIMKFDPLPWGPPYTYNLPPTVTQANVPGRVQGRN
ncbi:hypothetical protein M407DRAFT_27498 [Tulasnella calospora MUT 4182]|uniref:Uncharacterized protein n=1 Tax=Tulasnella calospora MUT 4182 TaxID=1051891 RepID=A0A0C3QCC1_9AGAM|nr:hypothetical protein M407DRAFT_27498 [Tulasnella calospora MUT 4182]